MTHRVRFSGAHFLEGDFTAMKVVVSNGGQCETSGAALKKLYAEPIFEVGDLPADSGRGDAKLLRRRRKAAKFDGAHEGCDFIEIVQAGALESEITNRRVRTSEDACHSATEANGV